MALRNPNDESQPLLASASTPTPDTAVETDKEPNTVPFGVLGYITAIIGVFLANVDTSLVLATYTSVASEFGDLSKGPWLLTSYLLGYSVALPAYGATSDRFGRKIPLLTAYCLFGIGCLISGTAASLLQVIIGRTVSGLGGAGMTAMVAIIITDVATLSQVAVLRSYVNVAAVVGRSAGGPIGGLLIDSIGWRWSFIAQVPIVLLCFVTAISQSLPPASDVRIGDHRRPSLDLFGLIAFACVLSSFLLIVDLGSRDVTRTQMIVALSVALAFSTVALVLIELLWAEKPILSPALLRRGSVVSYYVIQILLFCGQFSNASNSIAALHITPAPIGNAIGALLGGKLIDRTKRYKALSMCAVFLCLVGFTLIMARWRGRINVWESLYIFPATVGAGMLNTSQFVGLSASVEKPQSAMAVSIFFLSQQIGMMIGTSVSSTILRKAFRVALVKGLGQQEGSIAVIKGVLNDARYVFSLPKALQAIALASYVHGFLFASVLAVSSIGLIIPFAVIVRERRIT